MAEEKRKTLEELAAAVANTQQGLTPEEASVLFDPPPEPQVPPVTQPAVEPAPAPTPMAPPAQPAVAGAVQGEPIDLSVLPEKLRDKDVQTTLHKVAKSYGDLEAELQKQRSDVDNMKKIMESLTRAAPTPTPAPVSVPKQEDVDDSTFFEKPTRSTEIVAERVAAQKILQYHAGMERNRLINEFKGQHPDFDEVREDMIVILSQRPDLDQNPSNLPMVYNMAKELRVKKMDALRKSLGLDIQPVVPVAPTPIEPQFTVDEIVQKAKELLLADIKKRRGLSGIQGGSAPTTPQQRVAESGKPADLTPADIVLEEMLKSGPAKLGLEL